MSTDKLKSFCAHHSECTFKDTTCKFTWHPTGICFFSMCMPTPNGSGTCRAGKKCPLDHPVWIEGKIWQAADGTRFTFTDPKYKSGSDSDEAPAEPKPKSAAAIARAETKAAIKAARKAAARGIPFGDWADTQDKADQDSQAGQAPQATKAAKAAPGAFVGTFAEITKRANQASQPAAQASQAAQAPKVEPLSQVAAMHAEQTAATQAVWPGSQGAPCQKPAFDAGSQGVPATQAVWPPLPTKPDTPAIAKGEEKTQAPQTIQAEQAKPASQPATEPVSQATKPDACQKPAPIAACAIIGSQGAPAIEHQLKQCATLMTNADFDASMFDSIEANIKQELERLAVLVEQMQKLDTRLSKMRAVHQAFQ